jgi:hypothetical protein
MNIYEIACRLGEALDDLGETMPCARCFDPEDAAPEIDQDPRADCPDCAGEGRVNARFWVKQVASGERNPRNDEAGA